MCEDQQLYGYAVSHCRSYSLGVSQELYLPCSTICGKRYYWEPRLTLASYPGIVGAMSEVAA